MIVIDTDLESVELPKMDAFIKCQPFIQECKNEAVWLLIKSCGCDVPFCQPHKDRIDHMHEMLHNMSHLETICHGCDYVTTIGEFLRGLRWEKI